MEIKDILYKTIKKYGEQRILSDIAQGNSSDAINIICNDCIPILKNLEGENAEKIISFTEGLIHYLLTVALIPSQRKTTLNAINVDVVIPDISTLSTSAQNALVLAFQKTNDNQSINKRINELKMIQPHKENIWVILNNNLNLDVKTYQVDYSNLESFSNILNDIIWFVSNKKQSKLKIFKI